MEGGNCDHECGRHHQGHAAGYLTEVRPHECHQGDDRGKDQCHQSEADLLEVGEPLECSSLSPGHDQIVVEIIEYDIDRHLTNRNPEKRPWHIANDPTAGKGQLAA